MQTRTARGPVPMAILAVLLLPTRALAEAEAGVVDAKSAEPAGVQYITDEREHDALSVEEIDEMFAKIDKDTDGKISVAEVLKYNALMREAAAQGDAVQYLHEMDKDKDDHVSMEELLESLEEHGPDAKEHEAHKFTASDKNRDGKLSLEEMPSQFYPELDSEVLHASALKTMEKRDRDGDGMLTEEEFTGREEQAFSGADDGEGEGRKRFKEIDADGNGNVDLEELKHSLSQKLDMEKAFKEMFKLADKDEDGQLTVEEFKRARLDISELEAQEHLWDWREHGTWADHEEEL